MGDMAIYRKCVSRPATCMGSDARKMHAQLRMRELKCGAKGAPCTHTQILDTPAGNAKARIARADVFISCVCIGHHTGEHAVPHL